jgi:hypothetical protein
MVESILWRAGAAAVVAGPLLVTMTALAELYLTLPQPVLLSADGFAQFLIALPFAILFGFVPAMALTLTGTSLLTLAGATFPLLRSEQAWAAAGAGAGSLVAWLTGSPPGSAFGFITTSAICGLLCRIGADAD